MVAHVWTKPSPVQFAEIWHCYQTWKNDSGTKKAVHPQRCSEASAGSNRKGTLGGWLFVPINLEEPDKKSSYFESQQLQH